MKQHFPFALFCLILCGACNKEKVVSTDPVLDEFEQHVLPHLSLSQKAPDYRLNLPPYVDFVFSTDQPNAQKAQLGRVIFYDKHLSKDGKIACASCHHQKLAFADNVPMSLGVFGQKTKRNSMSLFNSFSLGAALGIDSIGHLDLPLFWDLRAATVSDQSKAAFENVQEMDMQMADVRKVIQAQPYYSWLFKQAWGDSIISDQRIFESLSHFMTGMGVQNTRFDQSLLAAGGSDKLEEDFPSFSPKENRGKTIYLDNCEGCHGSLTSMTKIFEANNGLESPIIDLGKGGISGFFYEKGIFKVPGLRNISLTAPYMHDGRFASLAQVVEHYNSGVKKVFALHGDLLTFNPINSTYSPKRLNLTDEDKDALILFLETLTDEKSLMDIRFSDPFR